MAYGSHPHLLCHKHKDTAQSTQRISCLSLCLYGKIKGRLCILSVYGSHPCLGLPVDLSDLNILPDICTWCGSWSCCSIPHYWSLNIKIIREIHFRSRSRSKCKSKTKAHQRNKSGNHTSKDAFFGIKFLMYADCDCVFIILYWSRFSRYVHIIDCVIKLRICSSWQ